MRIVVVHGYFLQGTGSNLFVANLCRELCLQGHEVLLFSQEQNPEALDFVARFVEFSDSNAEEVIRFERQTDYPGVCACYRPDLGGKLPVYVYDQYEGYQVKTFTELSKSEIEDYIERNRAALCTVLTDKKPDLILSNHIIMQPVYVKRVQAEIGPVPHFVTVHGSCLNFAVRRSQMLKEYAAEAIAAVDRLIFVSRFSQQEFSEFFEKLPIVIAKSEVIPAGVDVGHFQPLAAEEEKSERIKLVADYLRENGIIRESADTRVSDRQDGHEMWLPDVKAADRIQAIDWSKSKLVLYYGKYLWTKGIHVLIAAAPLVLARQPHTYFILAGFGSFRTYLERMVASLHQGQAQVFCEMAARIGEFCPEAGPAASLYFRSLLQKLEEPDFSREYFTAAASKIGDQIIFTGFLPHDYLRELIACADITVAPSVFPEAFGMVAIEALASGIIPLQTNHSGFSEVITKYSTALKPFLKNEVLPPLVLDEQLAITLAGNISKLLNFYFHTDPALRYEIRQRAREIAMEYSWSNMARQYVQLYKKTIQTREGGTFHENSTD